MARFIGLPEPLQEGRWWRWTWHLEATDADWPEPVRVPAPNDAIAENVGPVEGVVVVAKSAPGQIDLEALANQQPIPAAMLTYCSEIANHLQRQLGRPLRIDGHDRHPLLGLVKLDDD
jgi:hypothetical protein